MIVWLWDASGPARRGRGVTDDEGRARHAAVALLRTGEATTARVEQALTALDARTLIYGYARTGEGWQARRTPRGRIAWKRVTAATPRRAGPRADGHHPWPDSPENRPE
jgi:hypothetical protein